MRDPDAAAPLSTPRVRGYELIEAIGSGPAGTVYRARQPVTERMVAVKVIRGDLADDPTFARAFEARAQRIARLEHPHVVPLHDFWREPGKAFLVHRLIDGPDLDRSRREGPWTVDRVTRFVVEVRAGLAAGHALGLVHGGIRGSNVLFWTGRPTRISVTSRSSTCHLGAMPIRSVPTAPRSHGSHGRC